MLYAVAFYPTVIDQNLRLEPWHYRQLDALVPPLFNTLICQFHFQPSARRFAVSAVSRWVVLHIHKLSALDLIGIKTGSRSVVPVKARQQFGCRLLQSSRLRDSLPSRWISLWLCYLKRPRDWHLWPTPEWRQPRARIFH